MIVEGLKTLLLAQSSITTLVPAQSIKGTSFSGVFVGNVVEGFVPPYARIIDQSGENETLDGLMSVEVDIEAIAKVETLARQIGGVIKAYLESYSGAAGASDTVKMVLWKDGGYRYDFPDFGSDTKFHIKVHKFTVYYTTP